MISWGDGTIGQRNDLAPHWSNLSTRTQTQAQFMEAKCLRPLAGTFWASQWARNDAVNRYGLTNTRWVPFASNLKDPGAVPKESINSRPERLLAVWIQMAPEGHGQSRPGRGQTGGSRNGCSPRCGRCAPPPDHTSFRDHVTYHGRLKKERPSDVQKLHSLYSEVDIFVLATRNEPFGIVFQDAAAYGLSVVAAKVGGVPEIVEHDVTGITLDEDASLSDHSRSISSILNDESAHTTMSRSARMRYEEQFTWDRCGHRVMRLVDDLLQTRGRASQRG